MPPRGNLPARDRGQRDPAHIAACGAGLREEGHDGVGSMRDNLILTLRHINRDGTLRIRELLLTPWAAALLAAGFVLLLPYLAPAFGVPAAPGTVVHSDLGGPEGCRTAGRGDGPGAPLASAAGATERCAGRPGSRSTG